MGGEVEVGKTYIVCHEDCCLGVEFKSTLLSIDCPDDGMTTTKWSNGVEMRTLNKPRCEEVK